MNPLNIDHHLLIQVDAICINQITMRNIDCTYFTYFPLMVKFAPWNIDFHRVFCLVFFIRSCRWFWRWSLLADCSCLSPVVETSICCYGVEPITKAGASFLMVRGIGRFEVMLAVVVVLESTTPVSGLYGAAGLYRLYWLRRFWTSETEGCAVSLELVMVQRSLPQRGGFQRALAEYCCSQPGIFDLTPAW